jgi:hypothetical protein
MGKAEIAVKVVLRAGTDADHPVPKETGSPEGTLTSGPANVVSTTIPRQLIKNSNFHPIKLQMRRLPDIPE